MNKKGFEISFSWLFSIIAGISIFLFLVWFAVQQTDLFGNLTAKVAVEELDIAFTGFKSNLVGSKLEFGKEIKLEFKCDPSTLNEERMFVNGVAGKKLKGNIVFAPEGMKDNEFKFFTYGWNAPFRITNFIFITGNDKFFYLEDAPDEINKIPEMFIGSDETIQFIDLDSVNLVDCSDNVNGNKKKVFYEGQINGEYYGKLCDGGTDRDFYGNAMIYAYIFSDTSNFFCLTNHVALKKYENIRKVYLKKADGIGYGCSFRQAAIDAIKNLPEQVNELITANEGLLREGCEGIY
ncbi:hypothetical protein J4442_01660 [Candidatus Woesearchaeota archaeon]|nr:hypothetical protein [Candidatus Woesearchaeota archaeon]